MNDAFEKWKSDNDDPDAPYVPSRERERQAFLAGAVAMWESVKREVLKVLEGGAYR